MSDSQDVKIYPAGQRGDGQEGPRLHLRREGQAGKLNYYGKEYYFHYKPFIIDLLNVDSVSFYADSFEPDENGELWTVRVKNVLEKVTGTLEIDEPNNKSGIQQVMRDGKMKGRYPAVPEVQQHTGELRVLRPRAHPERRVQPRQVLLQERSLPDRQPGRLHQHGS